MYILTQIFLWLVILAYLAYLLVDMYVIPNYMGKSLATPVLRRRWGDAILILAAVIFGIYAALTNQKYTGFLLTLIILGAVVFYSSYHKTYWHLKEEGFIYMFKFIPYSAIKNTQLTENGILILDLTGGSKVYIAFKTIGDVEIAANFFADEKRLNKIAKNAPKDA